MPALLSVDPHAYIFAALLILLLPLNWLAATFFAAVFHEFCHIGVLLLLGGQIMHIRIGISGAVIDAHISDEWKELLSTLAGPLGSILLLNMHHWFPRLSICGLIQGIFNLLPLMPWDGGQILQCILDMMHVKKKDSILTYIEILTYLVIVFMAMASTSLFSAGFLPFFTAASLIIKVILRKRPCKQHQIKVQ